MSSRFASTFVLGSALVLMPAFVMAQTPSSRPSNDSPVPSRGQSASQSPGELSFDPAEASILRHRPWHDEYMPNQAPARAGFRNPGNVGRFAQYYPPGNQFQNPQEASGRHVTAQFGGGGVPDRASQIAAFNAGTARYNALQTHIDRYGRPLGGFGLGLGFGFGFGGR